MRLVVQVILVKFTGDPLHSRAACTQPCNVNTHSRAHCSRGARLCVQWGHGCVKNGARLCASARLRRGSPVKLQTQNEKSMRVAYIKTKINAVYVKKYWYKWQIVSIPKPGFNLYQMLTLSCVTNLYAVSVYANIGLSVCCTPNNHQNQCWFIRTVLCHSLNAIHLEMFIEIIHVSHLKIIYVKLKPHTRGPIGY